MTIEEFERDFDAKLAAMSDEELMQRLKEAGCKFEEPDDTEDWKTDQ